MRPRELTVLAERDEEAGCWVAHSDDVAGLVLEADTLDDLAKIASAAITRLHALSEMPPEDFVLVIREMTHSDEIRLRTG